MENQRGHDIYDRVLDSLHNIPITIDCFPDTDEFIKIKIKDDLIHQLRHFEVSFGSPISTTILETIETWMNTTPGIESVEVNLILS